jgi:hypothetical protein
MRFRLAMLAVIGCDPGEIDEDLPPFDPSAVIYADGCGVLPEAQACVDANPKSFDHSEAAQISQTCAELGYDCCDTSLWISTAAAECIAEQELRVVDFTDKIVDLTCIPDIIGATYGVYDIEANPSIGVGVHVATGRVIWFDDGTGTFS